MRAIRLHPNPDVSNPYSEANPAPASALKYDADVPQPQPSKPGELLIKIEASTVVRDALTWPETYLEQYPILGNDFAGIVVAVSEATDHSSFKLGQEVYGMSNAARAGTWAEYAIVLEDEVCVKPQSLTWPEAAAVPLSGLTAYQALFDKAGITVPQFDQLEEVSRKLHTSTSAQKDQILITGASGCVGLYLVQLAKLAGLYVVAASSSNTRNMGILSQLGADEVIEYNSVAETPGRFQTIIDTVGGDILQGCWQLVKDKGTIVTIDSASYDFVNEHQNLGLVKGHESVKALFFIVSPSGKQLQNLSAALESKALKPFVADVIPMADAHLAYDQSLKKPVGRGKIVLTLHGH